VKLDQLAQQSGWKSKGNENRTHDIESILNVVQKFNASLVLSEVLDLVLDEALRISGAQRGFVMLADKERKLRFVVGRDAKGNAIPEEKFQVSSGVLEDVYRTGESLCVENALSDQRFERRQGIVNVQLNTITCSALQTPEDTIGVIYVDSMYLQPINKGDVLHNVEILAGQAAIAIQNAKLYQDLKTAYEELKLANQQIIASKRMAIMAEIAAEVSHELKNLVGIVLLNLQRLQLRMEKLSPEQILTIVNSATDDARKLRNFAENMMTRAHASANLRPHNLNQVVSDFVEFVHTLPKFRKHEISASLAEELPPVEIDLDRIQQVMLNLVNNATDAAPEASIVFSTEHDKEKGHVRLSIADDGPGIKKSAREKLFKERITTKESGHGYGLPTCKQILESHGGSIELDDGHPRGAKFVLSFPVAKQQATSDGSAMAGAV
jgi:signal transduction histidine kinase